MYKRKRRTQGSAPFKRYKRMNYARRRITVKPEVKVYSIVTNPKAQVPIPINDTLPVLLNGIPVGTGSRERTGDTVKIIGLKLRLAMQQTTLLPLGSPTTRVITGSPWRVILVRDSSPCASSTKLDDVITLPAVFMSGFNYTNRKRFKVLLDKIISVDNGSRVFEKYFKLSFETTYNFSRIPMQQNDVSSNSLLLFMYRQDNSTALFESYCDYQISTYYVDN